MRTAIFGDVHGDAKRLRRALDALDGEFEELIFVGDYVDRGPDTRGVLDTLVALKATLRERLVLLRGNHDACLIRFIEGGGRSEFIGNGGLATVRSYLVDPLPTNPLDVFKATFPAHHQNLLKSTIGFFERDGLLVSHCGYNPKHPQSRRDEEMVEGRFPGIFVPTESRPQDLVVFGHYVQESRWPHITEGLVCIDTGCGTLSGGPLSVLLLPDHHVMQF